MPPNLSFLRNLFLSGLPIRYFFPRTATPFSFVQSIVASERLIAVDVGARGDIQPAWLALDGVVEVHGFEPDASAIPQMRENFNRRGNGDLYTIHQLGVAATTGLRDLFISGQASGASIYPMKGTTWERYGGVFPETTDTVEIKTCTLDSALDEAGIPRVAMIKLDIQGAELEVLKSLSADRLAGVDCLDLEILVPDDGIRPTFSEHLDFFRENGFELYDLKTHRAPIRTSNGALLNERHFGVRRPSLSISERLWEVDAILFRSLDAALEEADVGRIRTLIACLCTYNYFGEALWLANSERGKNILGKSADDTMQAVITWHRKLRRTLLDRALPGLKQITWLLKLLKISNRMKWARSQWLGHPSS